MGEQRLESSPLPYEVKDLEGNAQGVSFLETFGKSTIKAYVGFIDLAGFSTRVHGYSAQEISNYLSPFLNNIIKVLCDRHALVDKMIGDEIMFVLPDAEEAGTIPAELLLHQILGCLHDLAYKMAPEYRYRIGLSYGEVLVDQIKGDGYSEWTIVGEPVHVAERLQQVQGLEDPDPVCGAVGLSVGNESIDMVTQHLCRLLDIVAGIASRFGHVLQQEPQELKGVGKVLWALLEPKGMGNSW